jgi:hypothetical protein
MMDGSHSNPRSNLLTVRENEIPGAMKLEKCSDGREAEVEEPICALLHVSSDYDI